MSQALSEANGTLNRTRGLGPISAMFLVAGNMIGSGLFLLPASLAAIGSASLVGWVIASVGALLIAGVFATLGVIRPTPCTRSSASSPGVPTGSRPGSATSPSPSPRSAIWKCSCPRSSARSRP